MARPGWQAVEEEALRRIRSREWAPGALIPGEEELAEELGYARATVNRALRNLAEAGLLERRRKAGTRVAATPERRARLSIPILRAEVEARGAAYAHRLLSRAEAALPAAQAEAMGLAKGTPALSLRTLHLADGAPFAAETRWINLAAVPAAADAPFGTISANEWLVRHAPFARGTLDWSAVAAEPETAALLGCPEGTPLMQLERVTFGPDAAVTWVRLHHAPGHRLHLDI